MVQNVNSFGACYAPYIGLNDTIIFLASRRLHKILCYNKQMGKIDKLKESIGYLKVIFSILIAIDCFFGCLDFLKQRYHRRHQSNYFFYHRCVGYNSIDLYKQDHIKQN